MSGKIVEISCTSGHLDTLLSLGEEDSSVLLSGAVVGSAFGRASVRLFVETNRVQQTVDRLRSTLPPESEPLILILPVDAQIGSKQQNVLEIDTDQVVATREELFTNISKGTESDFNFFLLAILATIVVSIGLAEDNVAVVIGAMVIAPLLGPNLGLALGAALGDRELIKTALLTNFAGLSVTVFFAALIALIWPPDLASHELLSRTEVQAGSVILAFAAGVAAVQSVITRLASLLVGVMVAVALVPPATVLGMMISMQEWDLAAGAALLLTINVACVNLSAQLVFYLHGVRPRTWVEQRKAVQSSWINTFVWVFLLGLCIAILLLAQAR
ncbi:MAG: TIGR00341 family protein [Gammaproteobacteria bacterium]|nr:TIGR00341 family protein [Gammaproteobacteria bacterium]